MRIWLDTGAAGNLTLDDLRLIGMQKPFSLGEENFSSVFPNDAPIENYLSDKTAFHAFGKSVFVGGEKIYPDCNMEYDHGADEIYADKKTLYAAYGLHLTQSGNSLRGDNIVMTAGSDAVTVNGKKISLGQKVKRNGDDILAPLTAFSKKVLGLYTFTDGEGNSWGVEIVTDANGNPTNEVIVTTLPASVLSGEDEVPATGNGPTLF